MTKHALSRCRFCGTYPTFFNMSGGWNIYCDCLFGAGAAQDFYADWNDAVKSWNDNYGQPGTVVEEAAPIGEAPNCLCDSRELMWYGCRCAYSKWKQGSKNNA